MIDGELRKIVNSALDVAEQTWEKHGPSLVKAAAKRELREDAIAIPSQIPGHPIVFIERNEVDTFIAWVIDLRQSTHHINQAINAKISSGFQRIYFETSGLLPLAASIVQSEKGSVTEYLGDGLLALFNAGLQPDEAIRSASRSAREAIDGVRAILNPILAERYSLPPVVVGVGMALSRALVTTVRTPAFRRPKALGQCVFRASKLSKGWNETRVDEVLRLSWPNASKGGKIRFGPKKRDHEFDWYVCTQDQD
jgi:class 3 adenylate cyclase